MKSTLSFNQHTSMSNRPPTHLKQVAMELAALIHGGPSNQERVLELLKQLQHSHPLADTAIGSISGLKKPEPAIGIWKRVKKNEHFFYERDIKNKNEWPLWADVHRLYPKSAKKRIVLLGESVARGYFYEPFYTVSKELQEILNNNPGMENIEVIDLARTSVGMDELLDLAGACTDLKPDVVIIFAGNNWSSKLDASLSKKDYNDMFSAFKCGSFTDVKSFLENRFETIILSFMDKIKSLLTMQGIPVIFIIPGFNLKDWHSDDIEKSIPWMPEGRAEAWIDLRKEAYKAKELMDLEMFMQAATEMVAIDPSNPEGYELLAGAHMLQGKWVESARFLELARDTVLVSRGSNSKPRCFDVIRKTLIAHANEYGIKVVDADFICKKYAENNIPDRELFLDYCHHTITGVKIIMQHTTSVVAQLLLKQDISPSQINPSGIYPTNDTIAIAHFCAAIHNAHYGQSSSILDYHCHKAINLSPAVKDLMLQYADFSTRYASTLLCRAFGEMMLDGNMRQYEGGLALPHPHRRKLMDIALIDAITRALDTAGIDIEDYVGQLRKREHGIQDGRVNLLESFYSLTSYNEFIIKPEPDFLESRTTETKFHFIADQNQSLTFQMVFRTPGRTCAKATIEICLNDHSRAVHSLVVSEEWKNTSFTINKSLVKDGVNELSIRWPYSFEPLIPEEAVPGISFLKLLFPVFGEIYSLHVLAEKADVS